MKERSLIGLMVSLTIWATGSSPVLAQKQYQRSRSAADEVYLDNNCRRNQRLQQVDRLTVFYKSEFRANGQIYWLSAGRYQDGGVLFCISRPNFSEAKPLNAQEIQSHFIDKIVRDSNNNAAFVITVAEGNGSLIPYTAYGLDLSNPNSPVIQMLTILQQQGTLENGDSVLSSDRSLYDIHTFEGRAGQSIRIILESAFANYLVLIDPSGKKIAENYSTNQDLPKSEINFTLPTTGIYRVFVNGRNRSSQGPYALSINHNQLTVAGRSPNSGQQTATGRPSSSGNYSICQSSSNRDISRYCFRLGDSGTLIENLVEDLRVAGYYEGRTTNRFDSKVEQAVKRFQQDYRYTEAMSVLAVDGIVGPDTLLRLCQATRRGCGPNAGLECYQGSQMGVIRCLERYNQ